MKNLNKLLIITLIGTMIGVGAVAYSFTGVHYYNPQNDYEVAVEELNNYVPVFESNISDDQYGNVVGQTTIDQNGKIIKVTIESKDPFVVYHELGHVLHSDWTEQQCDEFAIQKTGDNDHWKSNSLGGY